MKFDPPLQSAIFERRYKRFLVDVLLSNGRRLTAHCPNTGSMAGCLEPGCEVLLSSSDNPKRKYPHTLELSKMNGTWVGVNTARTNHLVREAIENEVVEELGHVEALHREVTVFPGSRLDFMVEKDGKKIYLEVKNCTLVANDTALFPDAVTSRGTKHLGDLIRLREKGFGAVIFYCIQRGDCSRFSPAGYIDPTYEKTLRLAARKGVQILAYQAEVHPEEVVVRRSLPVNLNVSIK